MNNGSGLRTGKYAKENRLPYERSRIEEVREIVESGINPLHVTITTVGGHTKLTIKDVANYLEHFSVPFTGVVSSFKLEGDNNERTALIR